jgi:hypothetical protein
MHNVIITVVLSISVAGLAFFACREKQCGCCRSHAVTAALKHVASARPSSPISYQLAMDENHTVAWIMKGVRVTRSAIYENDTSVWIVTSVLAASAFLYLLWNHGAVETIDDGGIDVDALLEDTPEAAHERRLKKECTGVPAQQLLNALQKVWTA